MKYLKKFEAAGWQEFVSLLTDGQFRNRVANKKFVDLTKQEERSIINLVKPLVYTEEISLSFNIRMSRDGQKMSRISNGRNDILIYKSEHDEWYYALFGCDLYQPNLISNFRPYNLSNMRHPYDQNIEMVKKRFECDQFDGLLRLISEFMETINRKSNN